MEQCSTMEGTVTDWGDVGGAWQQGRHKGSQHGRLSHANLDLGQNKRTDPRIITQYSGIGP